jgi:adenosylhomocysteinase
MTADRISWVIGSCRLLRRIGDEFERTRPFQGLTIGTGIHLEPKTVALLLTLQRGGAELVATGNLNSTQPEAVRYLREAGITVIGDQTTDAGEHDRYLRQVLAARPAILLDNGGDLFARYLEDRYPHLLGGTEETTSGRERLVPLRPRLGVPILVINDSPIKQFAENRHAVGQSVLESYLRITNRATNGKQVVVFGYGACGQGVARNFREANATVAVIDTDPVRRLEAHFDGYLVPDRQTALGRADIVVTVTGQAGVIGAADLALLRDDAVLLNAGHFPHEIALVDISASDLVERVDGDADGITTIRRRDGGRFHVLTAGHMVNLAGPRPLGNSIESMDLGFALQARCLEAVATGRADPQAVVVPVPPAIDQLVAEAFLDAYAAPPGASAAP